MRPTLAIIVLLCASVLLGHAGSAVMAPSPPPSVECLREEVVRDSIGLDDIYDATGSAPSTAISLWDAETNTMCRTVGDE